MVSVLVKRAAEDSPRWTRAVDDAEDKGFLSSVPLTRELHPQTPSP
jgi:hypothetical protein